MKEIEILYNLIKSFFQRGFKKNLNLFVKGSEVDQVFFNTEIAMGFINIHLANENLYTLGSSYQKIINNEWFPDYIENINFDLVLKSMYKTKLYSDLKILVDKTEMTVSEYFPMVVSSILKNFLKFHNLIEKSFFSRSNTQYVDFIIKCEKFNEAYPKSFNIDKLKETISKRIKKLSEEELKKFIGEDLENFVSESDIKKELSRFKLFFNFFNLINEEQYKIKLNEKFKLTNNNFFDFEFVEIKLNELIERQYKKHMEKKKLEEIEQKIKLDKEIEQKLKLEKEQKDFIEALRQKKNYQIIRETFNLNLKKLIFKFVYEKILGSFITGTIKMRKGIEKRRKQNKVRMKFKK